MDNDTQALIDALRDKMADMSPMQLCHAFDMLCEGYLPCCYEYSPKGIKVVISDVDVPLGYEITPHPYGRI